MAKLSKCLTCGDQPLLRANCLACSGTGKRSPSPAKKAPAPRRVTPAASADFDGFDPADFDGDYQAGGRFSSEPAGLVLPPRPGPFADPLEALQKVWGYPHFRPGQREIVDTVLSGRNLLVVAATSFGKSLTFQLPALMRRDRPVLVVSPLIALMRNQVDDARSRGIPTVMVNSRLTRQEKDDSLAAIRSGRAALIYVAPEGLDNFMLRQAMAYCPPWLVAADEVHSVVESGLSYRPAYRFIQEMLAERHTEAPQWLTVTASATADTLADVQSRLGLEQAQVIRFTVDRPNLTYRVENLSVGGKLFRIPKLLREALGDCEKGSGAAIIYTLSRTDAEELSSYLQSQKFPVDFYHAGLSPKKREEVERRFFSKELNIVCSTCAFGMGIDRGDVRLVVMHGMPKSVEDLYQSMGRAGRDGKPSRCVALYDPSRDFDKRKWLINNGKNVERMAETFTDRGYSDNKLEEAREQQHALLRRVDTFLRRTGCIVQGLKVYFDEPAGEPCGRCSSCKPH